MRDFSQIVPKLSKAMYPLFSPVLEQKKWVDAQRPLDKDVEGKVLQKLRLEWNDNSNAILTMGYQDAETPEKVKTLKRIVGRYLLDYITQQTTPDQYTENGP